MAISIEGKSMPTVQGCTLRLNSGDGLGGGIWVNGGANALILDCDVRENSAGSGGGVCIDNASAIIRGCTIVDNRADFGGGLLLEGAKSAVVLATEITGNEAMVGGGGVYGNYARYLFDGCRIADNRSLGDGGACWWRESNGTISATAIVQNAAPGGTGGIHLDGATSLTVTHGELAGNGLAIFIDGAAGQPVDARHNWWGHASGPYHPSGNPAGLGDAVGDGVDFVPWASAAGGIGAGEAGHGENDVGAGVLDQTSGLRFPNPLSRGAAISYTLLAPSPVTLDAFDVTGRFVGRLTSGYHAAGRHRITWDARYVGGQAVIGRVLFLRLVTADAVLTRKATLVR